MTDDPTREPWTLAADGLELTVPRGWEVVLRDTENVLLAVAAPADGRPFRTNVVVTVEPVGTGLGAWQSVVEQTLPTMLDDYQVLDLDDAELAGATGAYRLAIHRVQGMPVTLEQHVAVVGGVGLTLSSTCPTAAWPRWREVGAALAASCTLVDADALVARVTTPGGTR